MYNDLIKEAKLAKIENPCGTNFCYANADDAKEGKQSKQKLSNSFYLSRSKNTSFVIEPPDKIVFVPESFKYAKQSNNVIQMSGTSKIPGILTLNTILPDAKDNFQNFFTELLKPEKLKNDGNLIFNKICIDFQIKEDIIPIFKKLKRENVVLKNVTIINTEAISIYNILYILLRSGVKFKNIDITAVVDSTKKNLEEDEKRQNALKALEAEKIDNIKYTSEEISGAVQKSTESESFKVYETGMEEDFTKSAEMIDISNKVIQDRKRMKGGGIFFSDPKPPESQNIADTDDGSAYFQKISFILGATKDS